ncbi:MAG: hypothetical protein IIY56_05850, partial [Erysipelotrichaceae bacterium]|nr:hypothetical protein [Erysipelotrichaceae bacterium]
AKQGTVQLNKKLANVDASESVLAEFLYQIRYKTEEDEGDAYHLLSNIHAGSEEEDEDYVFYKDSVSPVRYSHEGITIDGVNYEQVFILKPDETADISFPEDAISYQIVECGVNTDVYEEVKVNDTVITGTSEEGYAANRKDFAVPYEEINDRPKVNYVNKVDPDALRTLTLTKNLLAEDGETPIHYPDDKSEFSFRLYLASEFDTLDLANMHTYHVKDHEGYYCRWDADQQSFVKIGNGISDYDSLSDEQKKQASFLTSVYGSISNIPVDHTVEVRNVLAGTRFRVQERPSEIPDGYSFQKYRYKDEDRTETAEEGIMDTVVSNADPRIEVFNLKGWGLRMNKTWTDTDFMSEREPTYYAIYVNTGSSLTLVEGTVRQLKYETDPQSIYWYFDHLPDVSHNFKDYVIRELRITDPVVDEDGKVTSYGTIDPINNGEEITLSGRQKGEEQSLNFTYTVSYDPETEEGSNV